MTKPYHLINADCLEALKKFPDNSIEAVVTDAPYGLSKQPDIADLNTGRKFIGIEMSEEYYQIAKKRLEEALTPTKT